MLIYCKIINSIQIRFIYSEKNHDKEERKVNAKKTRS